METRATRRPGQKGTLKHLDQYGDRLLFVRYRYDPETNTRLTTVELIVDERPPRSPQARTTVAPDPAPSAAPAGGSAAEAKVAGQFRSELAAIRVEAREKALRERVRAAGGYWDPGRGVWILRADRVRILGLQFAPRPARARRPSDVAATRSTRCYAWHPSACAGMPVAYIGNSKCRLLHVRHLAD